jgi:hypothetical protein
VCDLFNGAYEVTLELLMRSFAHLGETPAELDVLIDAAITMMAEVLMPVGEYLTTLPAGSRHPGLNAGPSFQFFRSTQLLPHKTAAWHVFGERLESLALRTGQLASQSPSPSLTSAGEALHRIAGRFDTGEMGGR